MYAFLLLLSALAHTQVVADPPPSTEADAAVCVTMRKYEDQLRPRLPEMADPVTRLDAFTVDCDNRSLTWRRTLLGDPANLREGWQGRQQEDWNASVCNSQSFRAMVGAGWRFVDRYAFSDGTETVFEARCD